MRSRWVVNFFAFNLFLATESHFRNWNGMFPLRSPSLVEILGRTIWEYGMSSNLMARSAAQINQKSLVVYGNAAIVAQSCDDLYWYI